jgi:hypothetical protein
MKTYFARHSGKLALGNESLKRLRGENKIAIHYPWLADCPDAREDEIPDATSLNPNDYGRAGKSALGALLEASESGGYVCGTFRDSASAYLGKIMPGTPIALDSDVWQTTDHRNGRKAILKTLRVDKWIEVPASRQLLLLAIAPQQSTFCRWDAIGERVRFLIEDLPIEKNVGGLHSIQQEVMCAEFLRGTYHIDGFPRLASLMMPVGRTLKDIDILGVADDGQRLLAQVTYGTREEKLSRLREYQQGESIHLIYFCNESSLRKEDGIWIVPLRIAYEQFIASDVGKRWGAQIEGLL